MKKRTKIALVLAIAAALAKRTYPKAKLAWLVKRLLGFIATRIVPVPTPTLVSGVGVTSQIGRILKDMNCTKPLVVTDEMLVKLGLVKKCVDSLTASGLKHEIFDAVVPDPSSDLVERGHELYKKGCCDSIIAFGGGSPMDVAKVIGAKVCNPQPDVSAYQGYFRVNMGGLRGSLPPLIAVPTTAGTGSETTVAAVISNRRGKQKMFIFDLGLVPRVAVLDPELLIGLPKDVTSATGMDALTHAIESFVSGWSSAYSRKNSLLAANKIFQSVVVSYHTGSDLAAREAMLTASFEAGLAFTRANVGYVHAIAHQFGGMFHTAHGIANAMLLPHVLEFYIQDENETNGNRYCCCELFCELAKAGGIVSDYDKGDIKSVRAVTRQLVKRVSDMNMQMAIPSEITEIKASDVKEVAARALAEAHGEQHSLLRNPLMALLDLGYPVPKYMTSTECEQIIATFLPALERQKWSAA